MFHNYKKIQMNKLFSCPPCKHYNNLMIDDKSVSYITTPQTSNIIALIIDSLIPKTILRSNLTILDGTACVGGDSITFGKIFGAVVASEIKKHRYDMLVNNLREYELYNVVPVNEDCLKVCRRLNFIDIMYFDPPWGGEGYKNKNNIRLSIGDLYIDELVNLVFNKNPDNPIDASQPSNTWTMSDVKMVVLKIPKNYNLKELYEMTKSSKLNMLMYELNKMLIVVFTPLIL